MGRLIVTFQAGAERGWLANAAVVLCTAYVGALALFLVLRLALHRLPSFLALLNVFTPFLFLPLLLIIPLGLWLQSRAAVAGALALALVFVLRYGPLYLPRAGKGAGDGPRFKVMTFNTEVNRADPDSMVAAIRREDADVVALVELTPDKVTRLREDLSYAEMILRTERPILGLLSRYPVLDYRWVEVGEDEAYLSARIDVEGTPVHVFVIHPPAPEPVWLPGLPVPIGLRDEAPQRRVLEMTERMKEIQGPRIMMGDYNLSDQMRAYRIMTRTFNDAFREAGRGFGFTYPNGAQRQGIRVSIPFERLDYVVYSDELAAEESHVGCDVDSDHCYVTAILRIE